VLTDHPLVEPLLGMHELLDLALHQPRDRNARPPADHLGDVVLVHLFLHHRLLGRRRGRAELPLELRQLAVADLGDPLEITLALRPVSLHLELVDASRDLLHSVERVLLLRPPGGQLVAELLRLRELPFDRLANLVRLLGQGRELDLQLADAPVGLVQLERRGVDLHPQTRGGFVDEVDRLVGQEAIRDVAVGEHRGRHERGVANPDPVMRFVALLQAAEDRDRVGDRRRADQHRLEPALQGCVLLDVLAIFVERGRADRAQLAAREKRLQHVRRVDRALGSPRSHDRVELVDEEDDLPLRVLDLLEHRLQPLLELAAVLGAGEQGADVERPNPLSLQPLGHVPVDDPLREALDDGGLADSRLADEDRVVLRAPREHLDHAADLLVPADHRVEPPRLGERGQVASELLERLVGALRVLRGDPL
jgi:hypothetical protein